MRISVRAALHLAAVATLCLNGLELVAQVPGLLYSKGQTVVPVFEGWEPNTDGSFNMVFGYMNRNFEEELNIPVGASNSIEPGGPDQGQPTYFYPRRQQFILRVRVPKDWGARDLVWSITSRGVTEKAYGTLKPDFLIDQSLIIKNTVPAARLGVLDRNQPPTITVDPVPSRRSPPR